VTGKWDAKPVRDFRERVKRNARNAGMDLEQVVASVSIQQAREAVTALYLAAGALAIFESQPFERRFRDIHTLSQQMQGHAAHFETVGQIRMGMKPERPLFTF
jgi:hypothetical protein